MAAYRLRLPLPTVATTGCWRLNNLKPSRTRSNTSIKQQRDRRDQQHGDDFNVTAFTWHSDGEWGVGEISMRSGVWPARGSGWVGERCSLAGAPRVRHGPGLSGANSGEYGNTNRRECHALSAGSFDRARTVLPAPVGSGICAFEQIGIFQSEPLRFALSAAVPAVLRQQDTFFSFVNPKTRSISFRIGAGWHEHTRHATFVGHHWSCGQRGLMFCRRSIVRVWSVNSPACP